MKLYAGDTWIPTDTLTECITTEKINCAGSLKFSVTRNFAPILQDKTIITLIDGEETVFRGRVLSAVQRTAMPMAVVCEGELAFFNDSTAVGTIHGEIDDVISTLISVHNTRVAEWQQITEGNLNASGTEYSIGDQGKRVKTMELIQKAVEMEPNYFINFDGGVMNFQSRSMLNGQEIRFGENLISFQREHRYDDIFTRIYAYGTTQTGEKIKLDNPIDADAIYISKYGIIAKRIDVNADTTAELTRLARAALCIDHHDNIKIEAFDRHFLDSSIPRFRPRAVRVKSYPDNFDGAVILTEVTQDWLHPEKNKIQIGTTVRMIG